MGVIEIGHSFLFTISEARFQFVLKHSIKPTGIILCPKDVKMLIKFNRFATGRVIDSNKQLTLFGTTVYKSEDIKEGEIKFLID